MPRTVGQTIDDFWSNLGVNQLDEHEFDLMINLMTDDDVSSDTSFDSLTSLFSELLQVEQEITSEEERCQLLEKEDSSDESIPNDSDEESVPEQVRMEKGKGPAKPYDYFDNESSDMEYGDYNPYGRSGQTNKPARTRPKLASETLGRNPRILNLDCTNSLRDRKRLVEEWGAEISLTIQTNLDEYSDPDMVLLLMEHLTAGSVKSFIKTTKWSELSGGIYDLVMEGIHVMFLGEQPNEAFDKAKEQAAAKDKLLKMQLCDICSLDTFTCAFEKALYKLDSGDFPPIIEQYLAKIPEVGAKAQQRYKEEATGAMKYSLGFANKIVKEELKKVCELTRLQKKLKKFRKTCCKQVEERLEYGCRPIYKKKSKRRKPKVRKYKKYKPFKRRKKFKTGKYFRPKTEKKVCPKGKGKNCKCWICNVEGHYANECPNRQTSQKAHILQEAIQLGLQPVEDVYEGEQEVFVIEYIEVSEDETSTSEDDGTSTSEDSDSD
ncbi:capsid protein [Horseradish latent virus]|uniref:Coat protein n=1 Tax=Horseradish latent virus TaxID=264076 RepID=Q5J1S2_9VIRU|nr:capsid protein [Horseradish latent virus]AAW56088.1 capsid protein [Horseradish latent virus]